MLSTRRLLKFIDNHPNLSVFDISKKLFGSNFSLADKEISRIHNYLNFKTVDYYDKKDRLILLKTDISLNTSGKQYLEDKFNEKWRFRIPLIISIIAIAVSILSAYFTYLQIIRWYLQKILLLLTMKYK